MKRIALLCAVLFSAQVSEAQEEFKPSFGKVQKYLRQNNIAEAKRHIDGLLADPKENTKVRTWFYVGEVYQRIALSDSAPISNLDANALQKAIDAYAKVREMTAKSQNNEYRLRLDIPQPNIEDPTKIDQPVMTTFFEGAFNKGARLYSLNDYENAGKYFEAAAQLNETDTIAPFMLATSGYSLRNKEMLQKGIDRYYKNGGKTADLYLMGYNIAIEKEDLDGALDYVNQGLAKFPKSINLLKTKAQILNKQGKYDEAILELKKVLDINPDDDMTAFYIGNMYDGKKDYEQAITFYKKAIEMNKKNFEANFYLGLLYYKQAAESEEKWNEAREKKDAASMDKYEADIKSFCQKAMPYLEASYRLQPEGEQVDQVNAMLISIYRNLDMKDKIEAVKKRMKK